MQTAPHLRQNRALCNVLSHTNTHTHTRVLVKRLNNFALFVGQDYAGAGAGGGWIGVFDLAVDERAIRTARPETRARRFRLRLWLRQQSARACTTPIKIAIYLLASCNYLHIHWPHICLRDKLPGSVLSSETILIKLIKYAPCPGATHDHGGGLVGG